MRGAPHEAEKGCWDLIVVGQSARRHRFRSSVGARLDRHATPVLVVHEEPDAAPGTAPLRPSPPLAPRHRACRREGPVSRAAYRPENNVLGQIERFAQDVAPGVREAVAG